MSYRDLLIGIAGRNAIRIALVLAIAVVAAVGVRALYKQHATSRYETVARAIVAEISLPADIEFHAKIDRVRTFIGEHSSSKMDEIFYSMWNDPERLAEALLSHARGETTELARMECSRRTSLMAMLLRQIGIETRRLDIYDAETLTSHTFLDVFNPESQVWETQDPLYDLYWRDKATGARVTVVIRSDDLDSIEPCDARRCGWESGRIKASKITKFLDFIVVRELAGRRFTLYTLTADADRRYEYRRKSGTFCEVLPKNCRDGFMPVGTFAADAGAAR
jgi:hypothetical protein